MRDYTLIGAGSPATPLLAMGFLPVKIAPHRTGASTGGRRDTRMLAEGRAPRLMETEKRNCVSGRWKTRALSCPESQRPLYPRPLLGSVSLRVATVAAMGAEGPDPESHPGAVAPADVIWYHQRHCLELSECWTFQTEQ